MACGAPLPCTPWQAAEARVVEAQQSVPRLVAERWAAAGADRSSWPLAAQVRPRAGAWRSACEVHCTAGLLAGSAGMWLPCRSAHARASEPCAVDPAMPCPQPYLWFLQQEEIENVEARLNALHGALKEAQARLADATAAAAAHQRARAAAERAAESAQDAAGRQQREAEQRVQRAEAAASAASVQVGWGGRACSRCLLGEHGM